MYEKKRIVDNMSTVQKEFKFIVGVLVERGESKFLSLLSVL